eukprot:Skav215614  [mRNA]  locus=scaffold666:585055:598249:- [translate_table: standard]
MTVKPVECSVPKGNFAQRGVSNLAEGIDSFTGGSTAQQFVDRSGLGKPKHGPVWQLRSWDILARDECEPWLDDSDSDATTSTPRSASDTCELESPEPLPSETEDSIGEEEAERGSPVPTMIDAVKLYLEVAGVEPSDVSPPNGVEYLGSFACGRKDLCDLTGASFNEISASENKKEVREARAAAIAAKAVRRSGSSGTVDGELVKWHIVAFVGDALKVNDAVFNKLVKQVHYEPAGEGSKTVLLQMHCVIHQLSLTRKSLALGFSGLWSTLVRFGHLFESHSFRLAFKQAMRKVIGKSFFFLRVDALPSDAPTWRQARIKGLRLFADCSHSGGQKSGSASRRLKALLTCKTDNGDPHGNAFCHWCVGSECCSSVAAEALERMVCEYESIFDRLQVPLLYRWKHASQAVAFVRDGIFLHNIIPRTLNEMSNMKQKHGSSPGNENDDGDSRLGAGSDLYYQLVWEAAAALGIDSHCAEESDPAHVMAQVEELLQQDESYAAQNRKRQNLVREALSSPSFPAKMNLVDLLMEPMCAAINRLLKRSGTLTEMQLGQVPVTLEGLEGLSGLEGHQQKLKVQSLATFQDWASGRFGLTILHNVLQRVRSGDLIKFLQQSGDASLVKTCFELILFVVSDIWRRCCHSVQGFPWKLFTLLGCSDCNNFMVAWQAARAELMKCPECVDAGFSAPLLNSVDFAVLCKDTGADAVNQIQNILQDIATYCPLSSDPVEVSHGQYQNQFHRFRGNRKNPTTAAEHSILHSLKQEHAHLSKCVQAWTLPPKRNMGNQINNFKRPLRMRGLSRKQCVQKRALKKLRKVSGWNVFQRMSISKLGYKLPAQEFKSYLQELSAKWRLLPHDDRQAYVVQAEFEQACRDELAKRPYDSAAAASVARSSTSVEEDSKDAMGSVDTFSTARLQEICGELCRKKLSAKRLFLNKRDFESHTAWKAFGLGLQDSGGALRKDLILVDEPQEHIDSCLNNAIHKPSRPASVGDWAQQPDIHRQTCMSKFGCCRLSAHLDLAIKFAREFARSVSQRNIPSGGLIRLTWALSAGSAAASSEKIFFNGMLCKKPLEHVVVQACQPRVGFYQVALSAQGPLSLEVPLFMTTHQLFQQVLADLDGQVDKFHVEILSYDVGAILGTFQQLEVHVTEVQQRFDLLSKPPRKTPATKSSIALPFGAKIVKPKRKKKSAPPTQPKQAAGQKQMKIPDCFAEDIPVVDVGSSLSSSASGSISDSSSDDTSTSSSSSSSSSSSVASSASNDSDSDQDPVLQGFSNVEAPIQAGVEQLAPATHEAAAEAVIVTEVVDDLQAEHSQKARLSEQVQVKSTFFSVVVGFVQEISVAPTSRSICYQCSRKIEKGHFRLTYHFHVQRPSRYMHLSCVLPFVESNEAARKDQAIETLTALKSDLLLQRNLPAMEAVQSVLLQVSNVGVSTTSMSSTGAR